jgi:putative ABC transport system permease protein
MATASGAKAKWWWPSVRLQGGIAAAQLALATVLLVSASSLTEATRETLTLDPGFPVDEIQTASIQLPSTMRDAEVRNGFFRGLRDELWATGSPGIAFSDEPPLTNSRWSMTVRLPRDRDRTGISLPRMAVTPNYFKVMGISLIRGRTMSGDDEARELLVNQAAVRLLWPDDDPIGQILLAERGEDITAYQVVGIVKDVATHGLGETRPVIYRAPNYFNPTLLMRGMSPSTLEHIRTAAIRLEPMAGVSIRPLNSFSRESLALRMLGGQVGWSMGLVGLLLATCGIYAFFSHMVETRRKEIGIRVALGGRPVQIVLSVLRRTQRVVLAGLGVGFGLSLLLEPVLRSLRFELNTFSPLVLVEIGGIIASAAIVATVVPAWRSVRVDAVTMLRSE